MELKTKINPCENLSIESGYSHLNGEQDFVDDDFVTIFSHSLIRIPRRKAFLKLCWEKDKFKAFFDLLYTGKRIDRIWVGMTDKFVSMKAYLLGNFSLEYQMSDNSILFFKINNIFDKDYERIKGFQEERLSFYGGIKHKF